MGLGRQIGQINYGTFGVFSAELSAPLLIQFSIIQPSFLQKNKPLYPHPIYVFGIGIRIWAAKDIIPNDLQKPKHTFLMKIGIPSQVTLIVPRTHISSLENLHLSVLLVC